MTNIGKTAQTIGLTVVSIRHYEKIGLIKSIRLANGYRQYPENEIRKLKLIKKAKQLGFSLKEIETLLQFNTSFAKGHDVKRVLSEKLIRIEAQLMFLQELKQTYEVLLNSCHGNMPAHECPILQKLAT